MNRRVVQREQKTQRHRSNEKIKIPNHQDIRENQAARSNEHESFTLPRISLVISKALKNTERSSGAVTENHVVDRGTLNLRA